VVKAILSRRDISAAFHRSPLPFFSVSFDFGLAGVAGSLMRVSAFLLFFFPPHKTQSVFFPPLGQAAPRN